MKFLEWGLTRILSTVLSGPKLLPLLPCLAPFVARTKILGRLGGLPLLGKVANRGPRILI